jgi:cystathionine beta-lyase
VSNPWAGRSPGPPDQTYHGVVADPSLRAPFDVPLEELRRRSSLKWRQASDDVLPLWVAEMDVRLAEPVARALHDAINLGDTGYPFGSGYAAAWRDFAAERWGWSGLDVSRTSLVADVMVGALEALKLVAPAGAPVVITPPVYPPFYSFLRHAGYRLVEAPLTGEGRLDPGALEEAFTACRRWGPAALLLANPHNPTGAVHTAEELESLAQLARRYGVRVVADEIHAPLVLAGHRFTPYLSVSGAENAFSLLSASKAWNLPGLKAAVLVAGPEAAADLERLPEEVSHGPSHLGVISHTVALREAGPWLDQLLEALSENRSLLAALLTQYLPDVRWIAPEGTYLAWLDCARLGMAPAAGSVDASGDIHAMVGPAAAFLERGRVRLSSGAAFGRGGEQFVRLNFATSPAVLNEAVKRMGSVVAASSVTRPGQGRSAPAAVARSLHS